MKSMKSMKRLNAILCATAALAPCAFVAMFTSTTVNAQESAQSQMVIEEIIVTARKREELLQEVPMAVSVLTGERIDQTGVLNVEYLYGDVPNLYFAQNNTLSSQSDSREIMIRGVGAIPLLEPSAGVFIDGIYQTGLRFDISFLDLERVEVLRGPQGTLFGRNTQAGALNLVTRKPSDTFRARGSVRVDDNETRALDLSLSGPAVGDKLFAGFAATARTSEGFLDNEALNQPQDDHDAGAVRASLRYVIDDDWEVNFTGDLDTYRGGVQGHGVVAARGEEHTTRDDIVSDAELDSHGVSMRIDGSWQGMSVTSLTGKRENASIQLYDQDAMSPPEGNFQYLDLDQSIFSQELRLASEGEGPLSWLVGVYYFKETHDMNFKLGLPAVSGILAGTTADNFVSHEREGGALFGQVSYEFDQNWEVSAGIRASEEDIRATRLNQLDIPLLGALFTNESDKKDTYEDVSPMASLSYNFSDDLTLYATVSQGYKAGGFEKVPTTFVELSSVESEESLNSEIGLKGTAFDSRLQFSLAAFNIEIDDMQLMAIVEVMNIPQVVIDNAGSSKSRGFEAEFSARVNDNFTLSGNIGYTDTEFDEYVDAAGIDRRGQPFPGVPEYMAGMTADFRMPIEGSDRDIFALLRWRYVDDRFRPVGDQEQPGDPNTNLPSYHLVDLHVGVEMGNLRASLYATNLFDEYVILNRHNASFVGSDGSDPALILNYVGAPRTIGLRLDYNWQ